MYLNLKKILILSLTKDAPLGGSPVREAAPIKLEMLYPLRGFSRVTWPILRPGRVSALP